MSNYTVRADAETRWAVHTQACESRPIKAADCPYERAGLKETDTKTKRSGRQLKNVEH